MENSWKRKNRFSHHIPFHLFTNRIVIGYLTIIVIMGLNTFRAHQQSITHDEAYTYNWFVSQGFINIWLSFHSNNHTLHSLLMWMTTSIFGLSHLSMRIPALLGGLLYLCACERFCRILYRDPMRYLITLIALTTSPFILDYLVVARGYSLALGFFLAAFLLSWLKLQHVQKNENIYDWKCYAISCLCALSVASNLSFAFINSSLLFVLFIWFFLKEYFIQKTFKVSRSLNLLTALTLPGLILFLTINLAIIRYSDATMYYGAQSWLTTYQSILDALFDNFSPAMAASIWHRSILLTISYLPYLFATIFLLTYVLFFMKHFVQSHNQAAAIDARFKLFLLITSVLCITIVLHSCAYIIFNIWLPLERTGIFFVPLVILLISLALGDMIRFKSLRILQIPAWLGLLLTIIYFLSCLHFNYFREWKYDSGTSDIYLFLNSYHSKNHHSNIGINWLLEPSLNFYRHYYTDNKLAVFTRNNLNEKQSLFVILPYEPGTFFDEDRRFLDEQNLKIIYQHPLSKAVVAIKE